MSRTFVITGGAKGIGRCMVEYFASKGDKVYFIDNDAKTTIVVGNQLRGKGWDVHDFVGDIADKKTLIDFAAKVFQENPDGVHCLINNACLMRGGILKGCDYEDFLYIQQVGVVAPFMLSKLFKDHFCGVGSIVNISSTRAFQSQPNTESYSAAKGGITALTHAMAVSLSGVAYSEGDEKQHPSGRVGDPMDIVRAVEFLCDNRNSFINGQCITIDGGMSKLMVYHGDCGWKLQESED